MSTLVVLPILFPLIGVVINAFLGKRLGEKVVGALATLMCSAAFVVALMLFSQVSVSKEHAIHAEFGTWIGVGKLNVPFGFLVDSLSSALMLIITGVGALIHLYSIGYIHGDPRANRYFVYLNLFVASMLVLVMGSNYLLMFVGWELVGLCSYLLIGFWFDKVKNAEAARKAFVVNRIGDVGFILGIMLIFVTFGTLNYHDIFAVVGDPKTAALALAGDPVAPAVLSAITLLLFIGAMGKSAQLPLFVWLPDAMAGPTPASALIHAATMVTAGIYMIVRSNALFHVAADASNFVALIGALTAFIAGSIALRQFDIKKVLAYSTVSQLGFMIAAAGLGAYTASIFHLMTHAFFKALLFLAAGSVIHGMEHYSHAHHSAQHIDPQDMRNMGGLRGKMPVTFWAFIIGGLSLAGLPPFSGFWSKDEIIVAALHNPLVFALLACTAVFTAFYTGRQLVMVFFGSARSKDASHAEESGMAMKLPLIVLSVLALIGGGLNLPGSMWLEHWLEPVVGVHEGGFNLPIAALFSALALVALAAAWVMYRDGKRDTSLTPQLSPVSSFLNKAWQIDALYRAAIIMPFYALSSFLARVFDLGGIDGAVNGIGTLTKGIAAALRPLQSGFVRSYGLVMIVGVVALMAWLVINTR